MTPLQKLYESELSSLKTIVKKRLTGIQKEERSAADSEHEFHKMLWLKQIAAALRSGSNSTSSDKLTTFELKNSTTGKIEPVRLNPKLTIAENIRLLDKKVLKLSSRCSDLEQSIHLREKQKKDLHTISGMLTTLSDTSPATSALLQELNGVRDTLAALLPDIGSHPSPGASQGAAPSVSFRHFVFKNHSIYIGKNDKQNDELSTVFTASNDIWFHAAGCPGSHVVLKTVSAAPPDNDTVVYAASAAAWFSKARNAPFVDVHYTEGRHVHKRRNAPDGEVVLDRFRTLKVTPLNPQKQ